MKNSNRIAVVMSTYNGQEYIKEQLDSVLNQTYKSIDIYIRDDSSKDETYKILEKYRDENKNIFIIKGKNIGYAKSFYEVLKEAEDYEFYAFCDQDDRWHPDKIEKAIKLIKDNSKPTCVYTEYNICDENLNYVAVSTLNKGRMNFRNSLVEASISGNTTLFNNKMRDKILKIDEKYVCCHDWLLYMIGAGFGTLIYDKNPRLDYRRTGNNASPRGTNVLKLNYYRIKKFLFGEYLEDLKEQTIEFNKVFYNELSNEDKKTIGLFINKKYSLIIALKKFFYLKRFRQTFIDDLLVRFMFLIGKL